jgi:hypothetical protein
VLFFPIFEHVHDITKFLRSPVGVPWRERVADFELQAGAK